MTPRKSIVLVVDDQPLNIRMLAEALGDNYHVKAATCGETALKICRMAEPPDLILLDVLMPGMDGHEVCRALKEDPATRGIPVIFITAKNDSRDEEYGFSIGAVDYIAKPFSPVIVQARVRTHLTLKQNIDLLESMAFLDGLTGIANRRRFDRELDEQWQRSLAAQTPISLIIADIDRFKRYNDGYGHGPGDDCLKLIARAIAASALKSCDLVARYGGEEFVVLLPATDETGVRRVCRRIQERVAGLAIPHPYSDTADFVTVSLGGCTLVPTTGGSGTTLLALADQQLYRAKESGRNRFCFDGAPPLKGRGE